MRTAFGFFAAWTKIKGDEIMPSLAPFIFNSYLDLESSQIMKSLNHEASLSQQKDHISGHISTQVLALCENDIFPETLQNSEVTSSSNCCYDENSSFTANLSFPSDVDEKYSNEPLDPNQFRSDPNENLNASKNTSNSTPTTATTAGIVNNDTLSIIFDSQDELDNDIAASIDFSTSPPFSGAPYLTITQQDQLDFNSVDPRAQLTDIVGNDLTVSRYQADPAIPFMPPMLPSVYDEDCLSMMPPFLRLNPSASSQYSFIDPAMGFFLPGSQTASSLATDSSGIYTGTVLSGSELQSNETEYHGDSCGVFCPDQIQRVYNSSDIQSLSSDNQQLASGAVSTPMSTEISSLEDSPLKAGKLSVEQRKEKIHRYMKKRNERNFSKKIKYACRKTLADSRPRVRGRFAKNDEFGDAPRHIGSHHEEDEYDEVSVKEEDDLVDSSDIFAHISGVNSFKCGYSIQSWI